MPSLVFRSKIEKDRFVTQFLSHFCRPYIINSLPVISDVCHLPISFASSMDPDQARQNVGPDLDPNCFTLLYSILQEELFEEKNDLKKCQQTTEKPDCPACKESFFTLGDHLSRSVPSKTTVVSMEFTGIWLICTTSILITSLNQYRTISYC